MTAERRAARLAELHDLAVNRASLTEQLHRNAEQMVEAVYRLREEDDATMREIALATGNTDSYWSRRTIDKGAASRRPGRQRRQP